MVAPVQNEPRRLALGLALAVLFLVGQLSTFTHLLLVPHATCLAHGELIHLDGPPAAAAPATNEPAFAAAPPQSTNHGDEHCVVAASGRERSISPSSTGRLITSPRDGAVARLPRTVVIAPSLALLRLAPKSSPPA